MFPPSEITVGVIDDDIFEEDEYFYVHLSNPRVVGYPEIGTAPLDTSDTPKAVLGENHTATVTIYDDDHAGERTTSHTAAVEVISTFYACLSQNFSLPTTHHIYFFV